MESEILKGSKILIVDDKEANIEVLTGLLEFEGYRNIQTTTDSRKVVDIYKDFHPDLIVLDLMMPFLDGFEVMKLLRGIISREKYLPILVLTADNSDATKKKALASGATDFLSKPFDLVEVALRILNLLHINYLHKQLLNQNYILEERVKKRTEELRLQNEELKTAWKKAEASDRLKTSFINNISHEIRTPLNGIIGFTQLLSEPDISIEEREKYLEIIYESGDRLISTVTNFMDISLLNSGNMEITFKDVATDIIVLEMAEKIERVCKKQNLELEIQIDPLVQCETVKTDELLVKKVFSHLVDNALKFTREGKIIIGVKTRQNDLCFFIKDSGIGISDENRKDIFQNFAQHEFGLTRNYEGSGLGLSISKGLVRLLGGEIWFENNQEKGTTFYFTIPFLNNADKNRVTEKRSKLSTKTKILVVEDDEINFEYINILLKNKFIEVIHAIDGISAVEILRQQKDIKIILMDLILPKQDGFESTKQIKEIDQNIPIFAITALSFSEHREKAYASGCDEFIIKPLKKTELYEKLKKYDVYL